MAKLPPGYRIEIGGAVGESAKGSASIMAVIPVMFILMLFILMLQLHSTQKLLLVMLTAPLAIIGVTDRAARSATGRSASWPCSACSRSWA